MSKLLLSWFAGGNVARRFNLFELAGLSGFRCISMPWMSLQCTVVSPEDCFELTELSDWSHCSHCTIVIFILFNVDGRFELTELESPLRGRRQRGLDPTGNPNFCSCQ